jgi:hypothetical protein
MTMKFFSRRRDTQLRENRKQLAICGGSTVPARLFQAVRSILFPDQVVK